MPVSGSGEGGHFPPQKREQFENSARRRKSQVKTRRCRVISLTRQEKSIKPKNLFPFSTTPHRMRPRKNTNCYSVAWFYFHLGGVFCLQAVEGRVKCGKVDCDQNSWVCSQAGVSAYPTVKFYAGAKPGRQQARTLRQHGGCGCPSLYFVTVCGLVLFTFHDRVVRSRWTGDVSSFIIPDLPFQSWYGMELDHDATYLMNYLNRKVPKKVSLIHNRFSGLFYGRFWAQNNC